MLLFLDIIKPLGFSLYVEFIFLGLMFVALNQELKLALILSLIFGYLKDCFLAENQSLSMVEFPLICLLSHYLLSYFIFIGKKKYALIVKSIILAIALIIHITINSISANSFLPLFCLQFFIQSFLIYFFLKFLLQNWLPPHPSKIAR
jgi:hypothetical protein